MSPSATGSPPVGAPVSSSTTVQRREGTFRMGSPVPLMPQRPELPRAGRDRGPMRVPMRLADSGLVVIDATWGTIRPMQLADGVCTVGELEVMEHLDRGLSLIDTRPAEAYGSCRFPGRATSRTTRQWSASASSTRPADHLLLQRTAVRGTARGHRRAAHLQVPARRDPLLPRWLARLDQPGPTDRASRSARGEAPVRPRASSIVRSRSWNSSVVSSPRA